MSQLRIFPTPMNPFVWQIPSPPTLDQMRPTAIATLTSVAARNNARGYADLGLFEIGPAYAAMDRQVLSAAGLRTVRGRR